MAKSNDKRQVPWVGYAQVDVTDKMIDDLVPPADWSLSELDDLITSWASAGYTYSAKFASPYDTFEVSLYGNTFECANAGIRLAASAPDLETANQLLLMKIDIIGFDDWAAFVGSTTTKLYR
jgi:hypothetical protein